MFTFLYNLITNQAKKQKSNRIKLANHLEENVKDYAYDHSSFETCALGHAERINMIDGYDYREESAKTFGEGTYEDIFSGIYDFTREQVIMKLREWTPNRHQSRH